MVAKLIQRETEYNDLRSTEELFKWIGQMRTKKIKYLRNRNRNIRVEAVLGHALSHAEQQLRNKQISRIERWQELNDKMAAIKNQENDANNNVTSAIDVDEATDVWTDDACPELQSLDKFMTDLSSIKSPLQR